MARESGAEAVARPRFERVYDEHFEFVWRTLRRLGVPEAGVDDAAQEVFVVVHRKLPVFEGRSSVKTWLYGIVRRVASDQRRAAKRRRPEEQLREAHDPAGHGPGPEEELARREGAEILDRLLGELEPVKRETFVLAELEQMTAPEIADAMGTNPSTVYTRLAAARLAFNRAVARFRARRGR